MRLALFGGLACAALALGCAGPATGAAAKAPGEAAKAPEGDAALPPDFELPRLGGGSERLSAHFGKDVVLVDFWATFCKPCLRSMPDLDALYKKHQGRGFVVLGVSIDGPDSSADVQAAVSRLGVTFPILLDQESRAVTLYNPRASAPFSVLIGRDGRVLQKREGYAVGSHEELERDIEGALR